jgi:hypothetical protein
MNSNTSLYLGLAGMHVGVFVCGISAISSRNWWVKLCQLGGASLAGIFLFKAYEILPVYWWPDAPAYFNQWRNYCLYTVGGSQLLGWGLSRLHKAPKVDVR